MKWNKNHTVYFFFFFVEDEDFGVLLQALTGKFKQIELNVI